MTMYYQCLLTKGPAQTIAWIEERGAKVGCSVELKSADGDFWFVQKKFTFGLEEDKLREKQINDRNALPSIIGQVK